MKNTSVEIPTLVRMKPGALDRLGIYCRRADFRQVALLHNRDSRAARIAIGALTKEGFTVGDNQPYSGAVYGYTTDRHAETRGLPYLTLEIRQDLLADERAIAAWTARLARVIGIVESELLEVIA